MSWRALDWATESDIRSPTTKFILHLLANKADEDISCSPERNPATSKYTISKGGYPTKKKARKACRETMRQADWGRVMNHPGFDAHHLLSGEGACYAGQV